MTTAVWTVGGSGLLGSAIRREVARRDGWTDANAAPLPWHRPLDEVRAAARVTATRLARQKAASWCVIWAAGAAFTSTSTADTERESRVFRAALDGIRDGLRAARTPGCFYFASSAGGVYAGSASPPFDERTTPHPLSAYGELKLECEDALAATARELGAACLIARIANLYGPGQRLDKLQGLISHLALARLTARPATIFVPLDTLRDYLYGDDCAALSLDALERLQIEGGTVIKVLASGRAASIAALLGEFRHVSKGRPPVVLGQSPAARGQAHDLRLRSVIWPDLDRRRHTGLAEGIHSTLDGLAREYRSRGLARVGSP